MIKRLIQRFVPSVTRLTRRTAARGVAVGLWWAWLPVPAPSVYASLCAWKLGGNVPLAFACCWLRNPVTVLPAIYVCYRLGLLMIWAPVGPEAGYIEMGWSMLWPTVLGSVILAGASAATGFALVHALWRLSVSIRWKRRNARRAWVVDT